MTIVSQPKQAGMAYSKGAKLRAKRERGRPRDEDAAREPNGRKSRSGIDHGSADVVALDARRRQLGLSEDKAKDQKAGTFIGYLNLLGNLDGLSDDQYEALTNYTNLRNAWLRAIGAPGRQIDREGISASSGEITEAYEEWVSDTKERWADCRKAIQAAQNENRHTNLWAALDLCVHQDQRMYHLIGDLRVVSNSMARFFRV